jgi:hypothetical protein
MPNFHVHLNTDAASAEMDVSASSFHHAFDVAFSVDRDQLHFSFFTDPLPVNEIVITNERGEQRTWRSVELELRMAAEDLHISAMNLLTALGMPWPSRIKPVRACMRDLEEVVNRVEWRRRI